jgi:hypothetical protein
MEELNQFEEQDFKAELENKRKKRLTLLCTLSLISISVTLFTSILGFISGPLSVEELDKSFQGMNSILSGLGNSEEVEMAKKIAYEKMTIINSKFYLHGTMNLITLLSGLAGVLLMLRRNRLGFHFYIIYSILSLTFVYFVVPIKLAVKNEILLSALFNGLWIFLYARLLKIMN